MTDIQARLDAKNFAIQNLEAILAEAKKDKEHLEQQLAEAKKPKHGDYKLNKNGDWQLFVEDKDTHDIRLVQSSGLFPGKSDIWCINRNPLLTGNIQDYFDDLKAMKGDLSGSVHQNDSGAELSFEINDGSISVKVKTPLKNYISMSLSPSQFSLAIKGARRVLATQLRRQK